MQHEFSNKQTTIFARVSNNFQKSNIVSTKQIFTKVPKKESVLSDVLHETREYYFVRPLKALNASSRTERSRNFSTRINLRP